MAASPLQEAPPAILVPQEPAAPAKLEPEKFVCARAHEPQSVPREELDELMRKELSGDGGPQRLLQDLFPATKKKMFADIIRQMVPPGVDTDYFDRHMVPAVQELRAPGEGVQVVELLCLGYDTCCSLKPMVATHKALQLWGEYLVDGFITHDNPLLITQPQELCAAPGSPATCMDNWCHEADNQAMSIFSLGYVKGLARSVTALAVIAVSYKHNIDLQGTHPKLWESLRRVYIVKELGTENTLHVLMRAAKLSVRGSIRKPFNCLEWTICMRKLKNEIDDTSIITRWNSLASSEHKLHGRKHQSVACLLKLPDSVLERYLTHVQDHGWDHTCWNEDVLGEKRIHVGFKHGANTAAWSRRTIVSEASELMMIEHCEKLWEDTPGVLRRKFTKDMVINVSAVAAFIESCVQDLRAMGLDPASVEKSRAPFLQNDLNFTLEVQKAMQDKSPDFCVDSILYFKGLIQNYQDSTVADASSKKGRLISDALIIERKRFDIDMEAVTCDLHLVHMFRRKLEDREAHLYHTKLSWRSQRQQQARDIASQVLKKSCYFFTSEDKPAQIMKHIQEWHKKMANQVMLKNAKDLHFLVVMNWIAPSTIPSEHQRLHAMLTSLILNTVDPSDNLGVLIMPQWTYQRGQLYKQESLCLQNLANKKPELGPQICDHPRCPDGQA